MVGLEAKSRVWQKVVYSQETSYEAFPGEKFLSERITGVVRGVNIDIRVLHAGTQDKPRHLISGTVNGRDASISPCLDEAFVLFNRIAPRLRRKNK